MEMGATRYLCRGNCICIGMLACLALRVTTKPVSVARLCRRSDKPTQWHEVSFCGFIPSHGLTYAETFAMRCIIASTYGPRQSQDTKTAYAVHENALTGFTKESRNIGDLKPLVFVYVRVPRDSPAPEASGCPTSAARSFAKQSRKRPRWLSCRGHLTQT